MFIRTQTTLPVYGRTTTVLIMVIFYIIVSWFGIDRQPSSLSCAANTVNCEVK